MKSEQRLRLFSSRRQPPLLVTCFFSIQQDYVRESNELANSWILVKFCCERWRAISAPFDFHRQSRGAHQRRATICLLLIFLFAFIAQIPRYYEYDEFVCAIDFCENNNNNNYNVTFYKTVDSPLKENPVYIWVYKTVFIYGSRFFVPLLLLFYFNMKIICYIRSFGRRRRQQQISETDATITTGVSRSKKSSSVSSNVRGGTANRSSITYMTPSVSGGGGDGKYVSVLKSDEVFDNHSVQNAVKSEVKTKLAPIKCRSSWELTTHNQSTEMNPLLESAADDESGSRTSSDGTRSSPPQQRAKTTSWMHSTPELRQMIAVFPNDTFTSGSTKLNETFSRLLPSLPHLNMKLSSPDPAQGLHEIEFASPASSENKKRSNLPLQNEKKQSLRNLSLQSLSQMEYPTSPLAHISPSPRSCFSSGRAGGCGSVEGGARDIVSGNRNNDTANSSGGASGAVSGSAGGGGACYSSQGMEHRVTLICVLTVSTFLVTSSPHFLLSLLRRVDPSWKDVEAFQLARRFGIGLCNFNCCIMFVIFLVLSPRYRAVFRRLFCRFRMDT